jgi:S-formylglutathione hydrolase
MAAALTVLSEHACFGGVQGFYRHESSVIGLPMQFGVYRPPQAKGGAVPALFYLAGLTCSEETFAIKAGAQRVAAELGLMLVTPDTSPRNTGIAEADAAWDFGTAAGFYLDAVRPPWDLHWKMETYVVEELPAVISEHFPLQADRIGVFGHSMGGHGALTLALRHPGRYRSVSAFAPIAAPMRAPWGIKAFAGYLGEDRELWKRHDACELIASGARMPEALVDQGLADKFLDEQLYIEALESACRQAGQPLTVRRHAGHDHGYYFIASFVADHLAHHARFLRSTPGTSTS